MQSMKLISDQLKNVFLKSFLAIFHHYSVSTRAHRLAHTFY